MILAVNPNTGLDYVVFLDDLPSDGPAQARRVVWGMGGKALAAAWVLGTIGELVRVTGFAGGHVGQRLKALLEARSVECDFVWVEGESRLNVVLVMEPGVREVTVVAPGARVEEKDVSELRARTARALESASCLLLGGSLPPGCPVDLYAQLTLEARDAGIPVVLDAREEALRHGLSVAPTAVKPNRDEAEGLAGHPIRSIRDAVSAAGELQARGVRWVVITLDRQGLVGVGDGERWRVGPPAVKPVTTVGAGDAVTAGLAWGLRHGVSFPETLRMAAALAAATLRAPGTGDLCPGLVERLMREVVLERLA